MTRYYYAGGRRIELEPDDELVAVDQKVADAAGVRTVASRTASRRLPGGVFLASRADLEGSQLSALEKAGALRPVYRHERALLVALPEVRVEFDGVKQRKAVLEAISTAPVDIEVADDAEDRLVLKPRSGLSDDALDVANYVYERAHPAASSVRFLQIVQRPDPSA